MPKGKKKKVEEPVEEKQESEEDEAFDSGESEGEEEEDPILPFENDSEDEDEASTELKRGADDDQEVKDEIREGLDLVPLTNKKKRKNSGDITGDTSDSRVVYLGRIPYGFFEEQMKGFFTQFGTVTRLRLSRNKKTGKSKHYAFIEFDSHDVAKIVAESMDNYLLYGHKLSCKLVPNEKLHPATFKGSNRPFKKIPYRKIAKEKHNKPKDQEQTGRTIQRLVKKEAKKRNKLKELGIEYDFGGYAAKVVPAPTHKKFEET